MLLQSLPEGVKVEGAVRLCVEADLRPDGSFGHEWLVVTEDRVLVLTQVDGGVTQRLELPLAEVEEPRAETLAGGGALEVSHAGSRIELLRYTSSRVPRFAAAASLLSKWSKGEEVEIPEVEETQCPRCGLPLDKGTQVCSACLPKSRTLLRLVGYLVPHWKVAVSLSVIATVNTALGLVPPYLRKPLMDDVLAPTGPPKPLEERFLLLGYLVLSLVMSYVLMAVTGAFQGWLSALLGNQITHNIRCMLYKHLQCLSLRFYDERQLGGVISRVNQDTSQLQSFLVRGSQDLALNVMLIVGIGIMLFILNARLTILVCVPAPLVVLVSITFWKRTRRYMHRFFHRWSRLNSILNETLNGLRIVRVFGQEPREVTRFVRGSQELAATGIAAERLWSVVFSILSLLIILGTLLVWYVGGRQVLFGSVTVGTLMAFLAYVQMFYQPIQSMSTLLNWTSRSLTAAERVFEILDAEIEVEDAEDAVAMPEMQGRVEFRDVTFGYDPHHPVLKHITFELEPGEMIGLVGHSGAGKSTTINLLCRFYDVDEGEILIDGVPIRKIRLADLRRHMGVVLQETFLFSGTIAENIAYAKPGAAKQEIVSAAKIANAHDFILRKPDGYETLIGEGGQGLSAGERQRLAIARAVLHNPRILILDEATSQVDVETEKQIQEAIARLAEGRTTVAIAHRLATLKNADRLLVLKNGEIVEMGTHDELMQQKGEFYRLVSTYQEISKIRAVGR
ncbi:MAG: ABC transporter ATP-binding protein [Armatimonadota bacterium]